MLSKITIPTCCEELFNKQELCKCNIVSVFLVLIAKKQPEIFKIWLRYKYVLFEFSKIITNGVSKFDKDILGMALWYTIYMIYEYVCRICINCNIGINVGPVWVNKTNRNHFEAANKLEFEKS